MINSLAFHRFLVYQLGIYTTVSWIFGSLNRHSLNTFRYVGVEDFEHEFT